MLVTGTAVSEKMHSFERSIIFIPKWLDERLAMFSKGKETLKNIDGLFSILIPADVDFYLKQVSALASHEALKPYFQSFNVFSYRDSTSWGTNISAKKASKKYNEVMDILMRASVANDPHHYNPNKQPLDSYVDKYTSEDGYAAVAQRDVLASILGVDQHDTNVDFYNLRVILDELDADTLIMRLETIDPDQNKIAQVLHQTEANIRKITQYYEFSKVMASPVGMYYSRLVLATPNA